jgi:hypothetical protein
MEAEDLDLNAAARRLGPPTRGRARGDVIRRGFVAKFGPCAWGEVERETVDVELIVEEVPQLRPPPEVVGLVRRDLRADVALVLVARIYGDLSPDRSDIGCTTPAYSFGPHILAALATMGASLEFDEYVYVDDRPDSERPEDQRADRWGWAPGRILDGG